MKLKKLKKPQLDDCIQQCVWMKNLIGNELQHLMVSNNQRGNNTYIGNKDMAIPARIRIVSA